MSGGYILLIMGESGSGKSLLCSELETQYDYKQLQSYTTRPRRTPDEGGHVYVDDLFFDALHENEIVAYTEFHGYRYCATNGQVEDSDLYVVDPAGVLTFKTLYKGNKIPVVVYISSPEELREVRMIRRGDSPEQARSRIEHDRIAFEQAEQIADIVLNNDADTKPEDMVLELMQQLFHRKVQAKIQKSIADFAENKKTR